MKSRVLILLFLVMLSTFIISSCASSTTGTPAPTTALDGATLVAERCTACHPLSRVEAQRHTSAEWTNIVSMMIARGAQLSPDEQKVVVGYLTTNFGK